MKVVKCNVIGPDLSIIWFLFIESMIIKIKSKLQNIPWLRPYTFPYSRIYFVYCTVNRLWCTWLQSNSLWDQEVFKFISTYTGNTCNKFLSRCCLWISRISYVCMKCLVYSNFSYLEVIEFIGYLHADSQKFVVATD